MWDDGRSFATVGLLAVVDTREDIVELAPAGFGGSFAVVCGADRTLVFGAEVVEAAVADAEADVEDAVPSGAVESVVVSCSAVVAPEVLLIVDGRVGLVKDGFTVDRDAVVVGVGLGFADTVVEAADLGGTSR